MKRDLSLLLSLVLGTLLCQAAPSGRQAQNLVVTFTSGTVTVSNGSGNSAVRKGHQLQSGDTLATEADGWVDFGLEGTSSLRLSPQSRIVVIEATTQTYFVNELETTTRLQLDQGSLLSDIKKLSKSSKFEIKTSKSLAGIRGTAFQMDADGTCRVTKGMVVVVFSKPSDQIVAVAAGYSVEPPATGATTAPKPTPKDLARSLDRAFTDAAAHRIPKRR
jgi:hypothetical protein